jgi:hypothetical protein
VAEIVGALGVPHTPFYPRWSGEGPGCDTARFFAAVTRLGRWRDLIVMYTRSPQYFLPQPAGVRARRDQGFGGPNDEPRSVPPPHPVAFRRGGASARRMHYRRLRRRAGAGIYRRPFGSGAAALRGPAHACTRHSGVRQRACPAVAVSAALLAARSGDQRAIGQPGYGSR